MASLRVIFFIFATVISCTKVANATFELEDLVLMSGKWNGTVFKKQVAACINPSNEDGNVEVLIAGNDCSDYDALVADVPQCMLSPFSITQSSKDESRTFALTDSDRTKISKIAQKISWMMQLKNVGLYRIHLLLGMISHQYGPSGFFYCDNLLSFEHNPGVNDAFYCLCLDTFHQKYLRFDCFSMIPENTIRVGDLLKIKTLKNQNASHLQIRAQHLGGSFGEIMSNKSVLYNSRNQIEYPVQSLFDRSMTLRIRPKHLRRITKIYLYESQDFSLCGFVDLVTKLVADPKNQILHLSRETFGRYSMRIYQIRNNAQHNNIKSCISVFEFSQSSEKKVFVEDALSSMIHIPMFLDKNIWDRLITKMRKKVRTAHPNAREKMNKVLRKNNEIFQEHYDKFNELKVQNDNDSSIRKLTRSFATRVHKDLKKLIEQNPQIYVKLLDEIKEEMEEIVKEEHPDLYQASTKSKLEDLYQASIVIHYLRANAKGKDLHVFNSGHLHCEILLGINNALASKINAEWNINNLTKAKTLASRIVLMRLDWLTKA